MPEPMAYFNGNFLPSSQLALPVHDAGFVLGVAISEQMRTFRGELFRLDQHMNRLRRSLEVVGVAPELDMVALAEVARELVDRNHRLLHLDDDLGLSLFVTPGPYPTFAPAGLASQPTVCMHTYVLPFALWASKYETGQSLAVTDITQVPSTCWPRELKCRSRMHYYLADRQAAVHLPGARALLLDADGCVVEASTANIVIYDREQRLVSPPQTRILPGVSLAVLEELSAELGVEFEYRELHLGDLATAREAILTSTSSCVLPVVELNGEPLGSGVPGPIFERLLAAWSDTVQVPIRAQALRFADRERS